MNRLELILKAFNSLLHDGEVKLAPLRHFISIEDLLNSSDPDDTSRVMIHNIRYRDPGIVLPELLDIEKSRYEKNELVLQDRNGPSWINALDYTPGFRRMSERFSDCEVLDHVYGIYYPYKYLHMPNGHLRIISHHGMTIKKHAAPYKANLQPAY